MAVIQQLIAFFNALMLGAIAGLIYTLPYHWLPVFIQRLETKKHTRSIHVIGLISGAKIIGLALFFYYVLQHCQVNSILVLIGFFSVTLLSVQKAIRHGSA